MKRIYIAFVRDVYFCDEFDRIMGERRTSIKQKIPHEPTDPFVTVSLTINDTNTMSKVVGRQREHLNPDNTDSMVRIVDHKTFLFLCDLCVKANIMVHD